MVIARAWALRVLGTPLLQLKKITPLKGVFRKLEVGSLEVGSVASRNSFCTTNDGSVAFECQDGAWATHANIYPTSLKE